MPGFGRFFALFLRSLSLIIASLCRPAQDEGADGDRDGNDQDLYPVEELFWREPRPLPFAAVAEEYKNG